MNKTLEILLCTAIIIFARCTSESDIIVEDFESSILSGWTIEGDAFGNGTAEGTLSNQMEVIGYEGSRLANSYHGGDNSKGIMVSPEFKIKRNYINFLIGGGMHNETYIELVVDGKSEYKTSSIEESETLHWVTWNVKKFKGKKAFIRIVDERSGSWGHILIDHIVQSNIEKSEIIPDYTISFKITSKYLLFPIEDKGLESRFYLEFEGEIVSPLLYIRVAQSKIDYWMPLDVEKYMGNTITLNFKSVMKSDIGYNQIKLSDTFDFEYNEKNRPVYHFSPHYGWKNDPNGTVYHKGEFHLYYQYNPYGTSWGNMSWGHAVSKDMKKWEHLPVAMIPDEIGAIFSGSAVVDRDNTSGFGADVIVAIYTSAGIYQTQSIAYSSDNGRTFTKYENNPVLSDPDIIDFRDPRVFWHNDRKKWIMSLATGHTITFYESNNLKEWEKMSDFGTYIGAHGGVWECPDLFPLTYNGKEKWVLIVSINPGGPNGGSATQYFIGDFDGKTFKADPLPYPLWLDYGYDNYAGVTWNNVPAEDGRRLFIGWMSSWDYANQVPTINFRSASTLPRELKLIHNGKHLIVANPPVKEIREMRNETFNIPSFKTVKSYIIEKLAEGTGNNGAYELEMTVKPKGNFSFILSNKKGEKLAFHFNLKEEIINIDRTESGITDFSSKFTTPINAPLAKKGSYKINLFIDKASSELFIDNGELVSTNLIFPTEPYDILSFETESEIKVENINIYKIKW